MDILPTSLFNVSSVVNDSPNGENSYPFDASTCPKKANLIYGSDELAQLLFAVATSDVIIVLIVFPVIILFGLFVNFTFLLTICRVREMRTVTNFYLVNLAVSDLLFITATGFTYIYPRIVHNLRLPQTQIGCILSFTSVYLSYFTSIGLVTLVSLERFLAICYPLKHRVVKSKYRTTMLVVMTWCIAAVLTVIVVPGVGANVTTNCIIWPAEYRHKFPSMVSQCVSISAEMYIIGCTVTLISFIVALVCNSAFYTMIICRLSHRELTPIEHQDDRNQTQNVRNSVARMLILNGVVFFFCLSVTQLFNLNQIIMYTSNRRIYLIRPEHGWTVAWTGLVMSVLNSAINPVIYSVSNATYRKAFVRAVTFWTKTNPTEESFSMTLK